MQPARYSNMHKHCTGVALYTPMEEYAIAMVHNFVMTASINFLSGNVVEAVRHVRQINREISMAQAMSSAELYGYAKVLGVPIDLLQKTAQLGRLPVPFFGAGGVGMWGGCV